MSLYLIDRSNIAHLRTEKGFPSFAGTGIKSDTSEKDLELYSCV